MRLFAALLNSLGLIPGRLDCVYLPRLDPRYGSNCYDGSDGVFIFLEAAENRDLSSLMLFLRALGSCC